MIHIVQQSSLEKIKSDAGSFKKSFDSASVIQGEQFAFQIAIYSDKICGETVTFTKQIPLRHKLYLVKQVPVNWPHYADDAKEDYLLDSPGLLPDALVPLNKRLKLRINQYMTVIWVHLFTDFSGEVDLSFCFDSEDGEVVTNFKLNIIAPPLPPSAFEYTQYIDPVGIADSYHIPEYSNLFWEMLQKHFDLAYDLGANAIVTPIFPAVYNGNATFKPTQLVRVKTEGSKYVFNYDLLDCWLLFMKRGYLRHIVIPPIFPSFETLRCPDIKITRYLNESPLFRPGTTVTSPEYIEFMQRFLRKFLRHLKDINFEGKVTFQLTNDPRMEDLPNYQECCSKILSAIGKDRAVDGVVSREFYDQEHHSAPTFYLHNTTDFADLAAKTKCATFDIQSSKDFCNPLIASSAVRLRALGAYCYCHDVNGLLNVDINNCTTPFGDSSVEPFAETDNEKAFPSGSCHLIYPTIHGPIPSVRAMQILFAIQDLRVLKQLEAVESREKAFSVIGKDLKFEAPSITPEEFWAFRQKLCQSIKNKSEEL